MRQTVYLSKAIRIWICVICALIIISVYPFRLFRRTVTVGETDAPRFISQAVNDEHMVRQYFVAQYDKIDSVSVYVSSLDGGRYMAIALQKDSYSSICSRFIDLKNETVPGYITIPLGVELEPGERYNILLKGKLSSYHTAYVRFDADTPPGTETYLYDQEPVASVRLACSLTYDLPLSKQQSFIWMGVVFSVGVVLCTLIFVLFRKKPQADRLLMAGDAVFYPTAVFLAAGYAILFALNYPLRIFDKDPLEISFYAVGIVIAWVLSLYALYRFCKEERREDSLRGREWISASLMALALKYACDYMNGTYNLAHYISARQMIVCLLLMAAVLFPLRILMHPATLMFALLTAVPSVLWVREKWLAPEEELAKPVNLETTLTAVIVVLTAYIIGCLIMQAISVRKQKIPSLHEGTTYVTGRKIPWYLIFTASTGCMLIVFRNTRIWIPVLVVLYILIYLCARRKIYEGRWFIIVQYGVMIHFFCSLGYCLLHRGFQNHVFNRYGFVFSTVTITAQYMTMVCSVAAAALLSRLRDFLSGERISGSKRGIRIFVSYMWRELIFFGIAVSYMNFTISRLSTVAVVCLLLFLLCVQFFTCIKSKESQVSRAEKIVNMKRGLKQMLVSMVCFVLSAVVVFPAAFTLQRMIPSLYAEQHLLPDIEEVSGYAFYENNLRTPPFMLGKAGPDSAAYIRIRRFYHLFTNRIFGMEEIFDWYRFDPKNFDEYQIQEYWFNGEELPEGYKRLKEEAAIKAGKATADASEEQQYDNHEEAGSVEISESTQSTSSQEKAEEESLEPAGGQEQFDVSNGRFEIFKSYLANLNMTGHPEMTNENTVGPHAHNIYLQVAFDCGLPAGILFLAWIGLTILGALICYVKSIRGQTESELRRAVTYFLMLSIGVGFAVAGMFDWVFMLANPTTLIFMMSIAPLAVCDGKKENA